MSQWVGDPEAGYPQPGDPAWEQAKNGRAATPGADGIVGAEGASVSAARSPRPLRNLVLVERMPREGCTRNALGEDVTLGGIVLPRAFKRKHPSEKHLAVPDYWRGKVVAVGPDIPAGELAPGDEVLVLTYADNDRPMRSDGRRPLMQGGLYSGEDDGNGRLFVEYPGDILCALEAT